MKYRARESDAKDLALITAMELLPGWDFTISHCVFIWLRSHTSHSYIDWITEIYPQITLSQSCRFYFARYGETLHPISYNLQNPSIGVSSHLTVKVFSQKLHAWVFLLATLHKNAVLHKEIHQTLLFGVFHMETITSVVSLYYILVFIISLPNRMQKKWCFKVI